MARRCRISNFILTFSALIILSPLFGCGGSGSFNDHPLGQVPGSWNKYLVSGSVTATLDIYKSNGESQAHLDLIVDMTHGTVTAPPFKLPIGDTYRFLVIFNYALSSNESIPYAYADFTWLVDEFSETVIFSENDIRYRYDPQDPAISADLSDGKIPNLDLDGDGWSNWEELRDQVNPQDSNSVPILPNVEVHGSQDGNSTTATITVIAKDNAHVEQLRLLDPLCGVTVVSDSQVNNVDGSVTRTLILRLDLLSVGKNPRFLQAIADDGVTPAQNANQTLSFNLSGNASQPYFVFTDPEENAEVEGIMVFRGIACSRNSIKVDATRFLNQEINGFHWNGSRNDQTGDFELESSPVDTALLPDGLNTLKVEVQDAGNKVGQGSRVFKVVNDSQIKVVSPMGRRWVFGNEQIAVSVKNLPDSNLVVIEGDANFTLTSSASGGAVGTLHVANLPDGSVIPLKFKAVRADGSEIVREVEFTVRNKPQIQLFQPKAAEVFRNWSTNFSYRVVNVDPARLMIDGTTTDQKGNRQCEEDPVAKGITVCTGEFPVQPLSTRTYEISAVRSATAGEEQASCPNCSTQQGSEVKAVQFLPKDLPEVNVAIDQDDEAQNPEHIKFPADNPAKTYRLTMRKLRDDSVDFEGETSSGADVPIGGLEPRTDYQAVLQILSGPGGNVDREMFKNVTTGDLGLVGWWRFKDSYPGQDISGRNNNGTIVGASVIGSTDTDFAIELNDFGDYMDTPINDFSSQNGTIVFWYKPYFDLLNPIENGSNAGISALLVVGGWNVNSLRLLYSFDGTYCPDLSYRNSICFGVHGSPAETFSYMSEKSLPMSNDWNFLAATWSQVDHQITLYDNINGTTVSIPLNFSFSFALQKLSFGYSGETQSSWPTWAFWYKGLFQNVNVYNHSLSELEIKRICNGLHPGFCS